MSSQQPEGEPSVVKPRFAFPSYLNCLLGFFAVRLVAALVTYVGDCDETFNYWEPTHYLMYGTGFQTWEYSPEFGLRSYGYLLPHVGVGMLARLFTSNKIQVWFSIRTTLALFCAACEALFVQGVRYRFRDTIAWVTYAFLMVSAGMFQASVSFLPSAFAMCCIMAGMGCWMQQGSSRVSQFWTVFAFEAAALMGWPFSGLCAVPVALNLMTGSGYRFVKTVIWGLSALAIIMVPTCLVDHFFYRRWIVPVLNIALYNVFSKSRGALKLESGIFIEVTPGIREFRRHKAQDSPHQEERFLYVVYPLFCLAGAIGLVLLVSRLCFGRPPAPRKLHPTAQAALDARAAAAAAATVASTMATDRGADTINPRRHGRVPTTEPMMTSDAEEVPAPAPSPAPARPSARRLRQQRATAKAALLTILLAAAIVSASRALALYRGYHAPLQVWAELADHVLVPFRAHLQQAAPAAAAAAATAAPEVRVCVGKEWYRFPSSFFLPSPSDRLVFVRSGFTGLLPKPFAPLPNGTWQVPTQMNEFNKMEPSRYVDESQCHFMVEQEFPGQVEPRYAQMPQWSVEASHGFLDAARTPRLLRPLWLPTVSPRANCQTGYSILRNRNAVPDALWEAAIPKTHREALRVDRDVRRCP
ncbi:hypothetical protein; 2-mannosyltransferase ALG9 [Paratrimastix pyriformis]|uniref:Mannosyltransferase n=1 Tax=Paratrimastix pyriformis TaxID=342808 RepID=A0ABQ8UB77_9EUKA|nr:hypothetical protein; 2-mannosyltransferase ALG9 [Paratrimastix pyriformis]